MTKHIAAVARTRTQRTRGAAPRNLSLFGGIIGFVGLVVPHGIRLVWGHAHRRLMPAAFLVGGILLVAADVVARTAFAPLELPVGVVTAVLGVPVFVVLIRRWQT